MSHQCVPESGTVYTPEALALAMVLAARDAPECNWLDPCVGVGAFISAMAALDVPPTRIQAIDISPDGNVHDKLARTERGVDFIEWAGRHPACVDRVVMNPPYVALNRVQGSPLEHALKLQFADGRRLPYKANYWCAFVLSGIQCLKAGGTLVAVLPAAWDFARYASQVREEVLGAFREVSIVRCATPMFPTVRDGAVVIVARGRGQPHSVLRRVEVDDVKGMTRALGNIAQSLVPDGAIVARRLACATTRDVCLDELISIRIGGVTGDASYFLLTEAERVALGVPRSVVRPVLSRSRHMTAAIVTKVDWTRLKDMGERVWLFRPGDAELTHPAVHKYLEQGRTGACNVDAFKVRGRDPWHRTPLPGRVDGFFSGMSKRLPFLVLREMAELTATNTLYVVRFKKVRDASERAGLGIALLTSKVRRELARRARVYADGLLKLEPTELGRTRIPLVKAREDAQKVFSLATALLLAGQVADAEALADAWIAGEVVQLTTYHDAASPRERAVGGA